MNNSADEIEAARYRTLKTYTLFMGCQKSGHSLLGALLDAHADAIVSYQLDSFDLFQKENNRIRFFKALLVDARDTIITAKAEKKPYVVDSWQGRHRFIRTIGGRQGTIWALQIAKDPTLLDKLKDLAEVPVRVINVSRNPYDAVASVSVDNFRMTEEVANVYVTGINAIKKVRERLDPEELLDVRYENLVSRPRDTLQKVCRFLKLEPDDAYLEQCEKVIVKKTTRRRDEAWWEPVAKARLQHCINQTPFLADYTF